MARGQHTHFSAEEFERLRFALRRDPLTVLTHHRKMGGYYLRELDGWAEICEHDPQLADLIRDVARLVDMPEKPERRR